MARKKKNKIVVELDFPKNDTTLVKLYAIIVVSIIIGLGCCVMWVTNSGFVPTPNGEPMFTNLYCGATAKDPLTGAPMGQHFQTNQKPSYSANNSCVILQDHPDRVTWVSDKWNGITRRGKNFDVPGVEKEATGGVVLEQPLWLNCSVSADSPTEYTVAIRNKNADIIKYFNGTTGKENEKCEINLETINPDTRYELVIFANEEGKYISSFKFDMTVHYYDGIPTNMNNKSLWIGPAIPGTTLHPFIFLNFFGFTFFFFIFPASYYWEKVQEEVNRVEEKFPDFLRDLAEYWRGGLSMTVAVQTLARSEYGALNDEVKKMSDQLSWGVKFSDVITQFANRVGTPLVQRAIALIAEADRAGGKISDILLTAANDSRELKFLEGERKRAIGSYIAVIWTSYFVFLGVIVVLAKVFIPAIAGSNNGDETSEGSTIGNMTIRNIEPLFFVTIFYYGVTMQALGNGTMAGLMATGRFSTGFKHSGYMIVVALLVFNFIAFSPDLIGITSTPGLNPSSGSFVPSFIYFG